MAHGVQLLMEIVSPRTLVLLPVLIIKCDILSDIFNCLYCSIDGILYCMFDIGMVGYKCEPLHYMLFCLDNMFSLFQADGSVFKFC